MRAPVAVALSLISLSTTIAALSTVPSYGAEHVPFGDGERLLYSIGWYNIVGGTAELLVDETEYRGRAVYRIVSLAKSNAFVSMFFPVEDRIESLVDRKTLASLRLDTKQHEGKRRRARRTEFDQENHTATVIKNGERTVYHDIPPDAQDSLSCLYYFRSLPNLEVGKSVDIDVHESGKNWRLGITALNRERIKTEAGEFDTIRVTARVEFEGVFLDRGEVYVWITDDDRRLPVRMDSQIKIGRISAKLIEYRLGTGAEEAHLP